MLSCFTYPYQIPPYSVTESTDRVNLPYSLQQNSHTHPLNVVDQTLNVLFIEWGQKYVSMECNGHIEKVKLGTAGS